MNQHSSRAEPFEDLNALPRLESVVMTTPQPHGPPDPGPEGRANGNILNISSKQRQIIDAKRAEAQRKLQQNKKRKRIPDEVILLE